MGAGGLDPSRRTEVVHDSERTRVTRLFYAISWSDRARRELRASGETSRRRTSDTVSQLTPQEL